MLRAPLSDAGEDPHNGEGYPHQPQQQDFPNSTGNMAFGAKGGSFGFPGHSGFQHQQQTGIHQNGNGNGNNAPKLRKYDLNYVTIPETLGTASTEIRRVMLNVGPSKIFNIS